MQSASSTAGLSSFLRLAFALFSGRLCLGYFSIALYLLILLPWKLVGIRFRAAPTQRRMPDA